MKNFTYIVRCSDGTLYTGWTTDIDRRIKEHNKKTGSKYTRSRTPVELVYLESFSDKVSAMKREAAIKKFSRGEKLKLIDKKVERR